MDSTATKGSWYMNDSHCRSARTGEEVYAGDFNAAFHGLGHTFFNDFERMCLDQLPDSEEFVVVDVGSALGRQNTRVAARKRPNVRFYMVDKLGDWFMSRYKEMEKSYPNMGINEPLQGLGEPDTGDLEGWVNRALQRNGYKNVTFLRREMKPMNGGTNLADIAPVLDTRRVIFTGYHNPVGLGNVTVAEAIRHRAERLFLNNSAMERIAPGSEHWLPMKRYLSSDLRPAELDKLIGLIYDPDSDIDKEVYRYDSNNKSQKMFMSVLKQPFALAQVDTLQKAGMDVAMVVTAGPDEYITLNSPSQHIAARRK